MRLKDTRVQFESDGPTGATFIRVDGVLMTWIEFLRYCIQQKLDPQFAKDYYNALTLEILP